MFARPHRLLEESRAPALPLAGLSARAGDTLVQLPEGEAVATPTKNKVTLDEIRAGEKLLAAEAEARPTGPETSAAVLPHKDAVFPPLPGAGGAPPHEAAPPSDVGAQQEPDVASSAPPTSEPDGSPPSPEKAPLDQPTLSDDERALSVVKAELTMELGEDLPDAELEEIIAEQMKVIEDESVVLEKAISKAAESGPGAVAKQSTDLISSNLDASLEALEQNKTRWKGAARALSRTSAWQSVVVPESPVKPVAEVVVAPVDGGAGVDESTAPGRPQSADPDGTRTPPLPLDDVRREPGTDSERLLRAAAAENLQTSPSPTYSG